MNQADEGMLPPSFSEATGQHASLGRGLTFVDFHPKCLSSGNFCSPPAFESFRCLVYRANDWLWEHPEWEVKTCESVKFKTNSEIIDTEKMTYVEFEKSRPYVRSLRMWLVPRLDATRPPQLIQYEDLIPLKTGCAGSFGKPAFESLYQVLERYNHACRSKSPPGRVLTIESQEMRVSNYSSFDPDRTYWFVPEVGAKHYITILRVFSEVHSTGYGIIEEIGVADFKPRFLFSGGTFSVVEKASNWCAQQTSIRVCNVQSIVIDAESIVDAQRTCYRERSTFPVRILRVAYAKTARSLAPWYAPPPPCASLSPPVQLKMQCKMFVPAQLTRGFLESTFENLNATKRRVEAWISATGARVLSAETVPMRFKADRKGHLGLKLEDWIYVIRIYLDGEYTEPPPEMLPEILPVQEVGCCSIQ